MDPRNKKLADLLVNYSIQVKPGMNVIINYEGAACKPLVKELIRAVHAAGGRPFALISDSEINRELLLASSEEQLRCKNDYLIYQAKCMDASINVLGGDNASELADVPAEIQNLSRQLTRPLSEYRVNNLKWCLLRYPNAAMAQLAGTSQEAFTDFFFDVCTLDYAKMSKAMDPLVDLLNKSNDVHILGPGTDLRFSIKDMPAIKCAGDANIPDGEVFTAPVRDSMNGYIAYNTVSEEQGFTFENIRFEVENGRIVKATANDTERINKMLDTDEGARYFGEFAFGVNPYVLHPMKDTLFDEKIAGSFHLTPGRCYEEAPNGNNSTIHWDLVMIQRPEYGGGEIWLDDKLVRKDGLFVLPELYGLNPENLK